MTNTVKPIYNTLCAYSNCRNTSTRRLFFPIGFSALFCHKCAKILLTDRLATPEAPDYEKEAYMDGMYDID